MHFYCPQCDALVEEGATRCVKCPARFDLENGWRPTSKPGPVLSAGASVLEWIVWSVPAGIGLLVLAFLIAASSAVPGVSMVLVLVIALAAAGACIGMSVWLMLRGRFGFALILACALIPMMFVLGIGIEEAQLWLRQRNG